MPDVAPDIDPRYEGRATLRIRWREILLVEELQEVAHAGGSVEVRGAG